MSPVGGGVVTTGVNVKLCASLPLQVQSWTFTPSPKPFALTSKHLPLFALRNREKPAPRSSTPNDCAAVPLQVQSCTLVPSAVPLALISRHLLDVGFTSFTLPPPASCGTNDCAPEPL